MKLSELLNKDRAVLRGLPAKEKAKHIWHYYKWYFGALLLVIVYIASTIASSINTSNCILNGTFLNVTGSVSTLTDIGNAFQASADQDSNEQTVLIDTLYYSSQPNAEDATSVYETFQTLIAKAHAGDLDFLVAGSDTVNQLIYNEFFLDLSSFLSPEQLSAYEDKLLYMDRAFLESIRQLDASSVLNVPIAYPDPADPASMKDPIPVLIDIRDTQWVATIYPNDDGLYAFGLVTNGQHTQTALAFLDFLMKGNT